LNIIEFSGCSVVRISPLISSGELKKIDKKSNDEFILLIISGAELELGYYAYERLSQLARAFKPGILYSDYYDKSDTLVEHSLIDYQEGSIRDDFNFGHILFFRKDIFSEAVKELDAEIRYAGLYDLRLNISIKYPVMRIPEFLYSASVNKNDKNEYQFEYVDPRNRDVQVEMERVFTQYLKKINAFISANDMGIDLYSVSFKDEASVIIPVKNRVKTIPDAVNSVIKQKTDFPFNLIVVDNHSADGTSDLLSGLASKNKNLIHLIPERTDLGIGGCWNEGISHTECGRFAIQLDSDDIYSDENTLQKIVGRFREEKCAMVIGSYKLTDFKYNLIPPGIIDHKEWTLENGVNNALRINGLGAPRAFYTPVIREIKFPNVSYGEDYAAALAISRRYKTSRIYEPVYICRRWEGNSDASLTIEKLNRYNFYKDKIRTIEIFARQQLNRDGHDRN
jgi:hypothetical protein